VVRSLVTGLSCLGFEDLHASGMTSPRADGRREVPVHVQKDGPPFRAGDSATTAVEMALVSPALTNGISPTGRFRRHASVCVIGWRSPRSWVNR